MISLEEKGYEAHGIAMAKRGLRTAVCARWTWGFAAPTTFFTSAAMSTFVDGRRAWATVPTCGTNAVVILRNPAFDLDRYPLSNVFIAFPLTEADMPHGLPRELHARACRRSLITDRCCAKILICHNIILCNNVNILPLRRNMLYSADMALRLYNTFSKKVEDVVPLDPAGARVTMYTCGPTVYGRAHVGNLSSFLMADFLRRWLETGHGYKVLHAKNITDVGHLVADRDSGEDKIEKQAREEFGEVTHDTVLKVARLYENFYRSDEKALNMLEPWNRPRASEYVDHMKTMVEALLAKGFAYATADGIYFDVTSKTRTPYGSLSGNTLDAVEAGARVEVNDEKKHPADFALWKFCVGQNEHHALRWSSPGEGHPEGFPGWHIECSAMARAILGDTIDIHTGGEDNIFPHHECEIAQSESVTGKQFVRTWLHKRRIDLAAEKMSKSLGNVVTLSDILDRGYDAADLRLYFLSVHYRTNLKFTWEGLDEAKVARRKIADAFAKVDARTDAVREPLDAVAAEVRAFDAEFRAAMDADLNAAGALAAVHGVVKIINAIDARPGVAYGDADLGALRAFVALARDTFGCFDAPAAVRIPDDVQALLDQRAAAREAKNFAESDRLRVEIEKRGFTLKDTADGQRVDKA